MTPEQWGAATRRLQESRGIYCCLTGDGNVTLNGEFSADDLRAVLRELDPEGEYPPMMVQYNLAPEDLATAMQLLARLRTRPLVLPTSVEVAGRRIMERIVARALGNSGPAPEEVKPDAVVGAP